jgi:hypothetical protein
MKISGRIVNVGRLDAHIEGAVFRWNSSSDDGLMRVTALACGLPDDHVQSMTLPLALPAQTGSEFSVVDLNGVDLGLAVALHDRRNVALVFRTASGKSIRGRIKYGRSAAS